MIKLAVFDFDSTLMDGETIDFLAQECGALQQVTILRIAVGLLEFFTHFLKKHRLAPSVLLVF